MKPLLSLIYDIFNKRTYRIKSYKNMFGNNVYDIYKGSSRIKTVFNNEQDALAYIKTHTKVQELLKQEFIDRSTAKKKAIDINNIYG